MRVTEFQNPNNNLFESAVEDQILDVATSGDGAWSKPMSIEDMKASLQAMLTQNENAGNNPKV